MNESRGTMNKSEINKLNITGMLLQAAFWFGICTYMAFMVTTLMDYGWSASAAAGAMAAMSIVAMVMQPLYGYISDKYLSEKKLSILLLVLTVVCFALMPFSLGSGSRALVIINMTAIAMTGLHVNSLVDAWIIGLKQELPSINYGLMRGTGSLAFALSAQIAGTVSAAFGHNARLWLGCAALLLAVCVALSFRPTRPHRQSGEGGAAGKLGGMEAFRLIFSSRQYCLLLSSAFFLLLSNSAIITLIQLLIRDFDGTTAQMGTASALMAGSEVPLMFLMAALMKKIGFKQLIVFCGAAYVIRMFITASVGTISGLMYAMLLQGITFAVLIPLSMSYLSKIVDERVRSTAVTTYAAICFSLTGILANFITSALLAAGFSVQDAVLFFAFTTLAGFALTLYGYVRKIW